LHEQGNMEWRYERARTTQSPTGYKKSVYVQDGASGNIHNLIADGDDKNVECHHPNGDGTSNGDNPRSGSDLDRLRNGELILPHLPNMMPGPVNKVFPVLSAAPVRLRAPDVPKVHSQNIPAMVNNNDGIVTYMGSLRRSQLTQLPKKCPLCLTLKPNIDHIAQYHPEETFLAMGSEGSYNIQAALFNIMDRKNLNPYQISAVVLRKHDLLRYPLPRFAAVFHCTTCGKTIQRCSYSLTKHNQHCKGCLKGFCRLCDRLFTSISEAEKHVDASVANISVFCFPEVDVLAHIWKEVLFSRQMSHFSRPLPASDPSLTTLTVIPPQEAIIASSYEGSSFSSECSRTASSIPFSKVNNILKYFDGATTSSSGQSSLSRKPLSNETPEKIPRLEMNDLYSNDDDSEVEAAGHPTEVVHFFKTSSKAMTDTYAHWQSSPEEPPQRFDAYSINVENEEVTEKSSSPDRGQQPLLCQSRYYVKKPSPSWTSPQLPLEVPDPVNVDSHSLISPIVIICSKSRKLQDPRLANKSKQDKVIPFKKIPMTWLHESHERAIGTAPSLLIPLDRINEYKYNISNPHKDGD